jgi:hypothetical protein
MQYLLSSMTKLVKKYEYFINKFSFDLMLDSFLGSESTGVKFENSDFQKAEKLKLVVELISLHISFFSKFQFFFHLVIKMGKTAFMKFSKDYWSLQ